MFLGDWTFGKIWRLRSGAMDKPEAFLTADGDHGFALVLEPHRTFLAKHSHFESVEAAIRDDFERYYTVEFENYPVQIEHYLPHRTVVPCSLS